MPASNFASNVLDLLERTEYRRCDHGEDLESIYRLRYKSYLASGMVSANSQRMVMDGLDELPNSMRFGIYVDGVLVSTLRLHHVTADRRQSPSTAVYGDILHPRIDAGETFIDPSRFAADPDWTAQYPHLPYITLRLAAMACKYFEPDYCLSTIRPDHAAFYKRVFDAQQVGELRPYPALNYPVVLYQAHFASIAARTGLRFPFFKSTTFEQRLMFGKPHEGELEPLTILPTAKFMATAA
ncbi:MAG: hypothetical protein Q8Q62_15530 [Mesorhizobium sp.]|nr:hypothetical protein [Mesorhizobium sp.]